MYLLIKFFAIGNRKFVRFFKLFRRKIYVPTQNTANQVVTIFINVKLLKDANA